LEQTGERGLRDFLHIGRKKGRGKGGLNLPRVGEGEEGPRGPRKDRSGKDGGRKGKPEVGEPFQKSSKMLWKKALGLFDPIY